MRLSLTFFGTGTSTGVPVIGCQCETCTSYDPRDKRLRTSALVEIEDGPTLLIDTGPDFRYQMLRSHTKKIDAILITHKHYDHVGGLDDVRGLNYTTRNDVSVFAQPNVAASIRRNLHYAFAASPYPGAPKISLNEIATETFEAAGVEVTTLPVIPERATIDIVLNAPQHNYLFMCASPKFNGTHDFAVDYATHQKNARAYQAELNRRGIHE